jgi:DNA-directed RNA polymerase subunit H
MIWKYTCLSEKKFDLFDHFLVPKHILLTEEEAKEVLEKYRIRPYQLPHIKATEPAARAVGAKRGSVIKIMRKSPTAGEAIAYRYVVGG